MMYAQVVNGTVETVSKSLPNGARRLDNQQWVIGLPDASTALQEACGWFQVVDTARPADTATDTYVRSVEVVGGVPTVVWTATPKSAEQIEADRVSTQDATLRSQARTAHTNNQTYIALASPSNAQIAAQVKALTRQVNALIELVVARDLI